MTEAGKASFSLQGAGNGFKGRSSDIFSCLDVIEDKHSAVEKTQQKDGGIMFKTDDQLDVISRDDTGSKDKGHKRKSYDESNTGGLNKRDFKVPRGLPPSRWPKKPDHKVQPKNWTFYNLSDVDSSKMSEQSNRSAALSFLDDLKKRKEDESEEAVEPPDLTAKIVFKKPKSAQNDPDNDNKIVFKKPKSAQNDPDNDNKIVFKKPKSAPNNPKTDNKMDESSKETSTYVSGKVVMPEYSFKNSKKTKSKCSKSGLKSECGKKSTGVKLGHLDDDEEDDDDSS